MSSHRLRLPLLTQLWRLVEVEHIRLGCQRRQASQRARKQRRQNPHAVAIFMSQLPIVSTGGPHHSFAVLARGWACWEVKVLPVDSDGERMGEDPDRDGDGALGYAPVHQQASLCPRPVPSHSLASARPAQQPIPLSSPACRNEYIQKGNDFMKAGVANSKRLLPPGSLARRKAMLADFPHKVLHRWLAVRNRLSCCPHQMAGPLQATVAAYPADRDALKSQVMTPPCSAHELSPR